jgi:MYXO-CTERM domain-containing protein
MDASMIRIICAVMAALLIGVIVLRRRRRAE